MSQAAFNCLFLLGFAFVSWPIVFCFGKYWERNRLAKIRKASIRTRPFLPSQCTLN